MAILYNDKGGSILRFVLADGTKTATRLALCHLNMLGRSLRTQVSRTRSRHRNESSEKGSRTLKSQPSKECRRLFDSIPSRTYSTSKPPVKDGTFVEDEDNGLRILRITEEDRQLFTSLKLDHEGAIIALSYEPRSPSKPIHAEAIIGFLNNEPVFDKRKQTWELDPTAFIENPKFHQFLQQTIAKYCYESSALAVLADTTKTGWMGVLDQRTPYPDNRRPVEDIFGYVLLEDGKMLPGTYKPMPSHRILTIAGPCKVDPDIHTKFIAELSKL